MTAEEQQHWKNKGTELAELLGSNPNRVTLEFSSDEVKATFNKIIESIDSQLQTFALRMRSANVQIQLSQEDAQVLLFVLKQ